MITWVSVLRLSFENRSIGGIINCTVAKGQLQISGFRDKQGKSEDNQKNFKALSERLAKKKDKRWSPGSLRTDLKSNRILPRSLFGY